MDGPGGGADGRELSFAHPIPRRFYARSAEIVARELLGARLVRRSPGGFRAVTIVETEAYLADDPASHAFRGPTARNRTMFGRPGSLYVFSIHRVHCANAVARRGEAALLRGGEPVLGVPAPVPGPGRLAQAMGLTRLDDGLDLIRSDVRIVPGPPRTVEIGCGPRIGISRARERPLRFWVVGSPGVSRPRAAYLSLAHS